MNYSLIIATFNRVEEMQELIASTSALDFDMKSFEMVVVDDGSTDSTRQFIEQASTPFSIQYHYQQNQGPGKARNLAMTKAKGDYFIFIDSDCILPPNYLAKVDAFLNENPVDAFGGPDDSHPSFPPILKAINYSMTSFLGTGGTRGSTKSVTKFYPRSFNMGIKREVFDSIGGMNDLRHGQDMDYSSRIYRAGFEVALIPDAVVFHKRRTNLKKFFKQIFNWGVARINLGQQYSEMLRPVHLIPAFLVALSILIAVLSVFFPVFQLLLKLGIVVLVSLALMAFVQSFVQYKNIVVSLLSIVTLFTQVLAYGLGTWSGIIQVLKGKKRAEGFTKNYYK